MHDLLIEAVLGRGVRVTKQNNHNKETFKVVNRIPLPNLDVYVFNKG